MVSFVIAKGLMQARDYVAEELAKQEPPVEEKVKGENGKPSPLKIKPHG
jgi:hypothetical protein